MITTIEENKTETLLQFNRVILHLTVLAKNLSIFWYLDEEELVSLLYKEYKISTNSKEALKALTYIQVIENKIEIEEDFYDGF